MKPVFLAVLFFLAVAPALTFAQTMVGDEHGRVYAVLSAADPNLEKTGVSPRHHSKHQSVDGASGAFTVAGSSPRFELEFADVADGTGSGFDDPEQGAARRQVAVAAFEMISRLLAGNTGSAKIRIDSRSAYFGTNTLAVGIPYFQCLPGFQRPIIHAALTLDEHVHVIDGELAVNFDQPFNASMSDPGATEFDLFTSMLHEIVHVLGFIGFDVGSDGLPADCGGARMLPEVARYALGQDGNALWIETPGGIEFTGTPASLPAYGNPVRLQLPDALGSSARISTGELSTVGHWHPEDFQQRLEVLMIDQDLQAGSRRRNLTPETKAILASAGGFEVGDAMRGLTGSWYDPNSNGQGFSLQFISEDRFVIYFFGFRDTGERLWIIGVHDGGLQFGNTFTVNLFETTGGIFNGAENGQVVEHDWGSLTVRFDDCRSASVTLDGTDGFQQLSLQRLAGVEGLDCY